MLRQMLPWPVATVTSDATASRCLPGDSDNIHEESLTWRSNRSEALWREAVLTSVDGKDLASESRRSDPRKGPKYSDTSANEDNSFRNHIR